MRLVQHIVSISIHTPLAGSDGTARPWSRPCGNFNPHSPCGERRGRRSSCLPSSYFNPHSPCGERQYAYRHPSVKVEISIHTPLAGSDEAGAAVLVKADVISIHTPLAGSDSLLCGRYQYNKFQSTLLLRGATPASRRLRDMIEFQSTLPLRGATSGLIRARNADGISIHTPLAGSDGPCTGRRRLSLRNFNPHSPCGERPMPAAGRSPRFLFQSTLPLRGATSGEVPSNQRGREFQSTLPLRGATCRSKAYQPDP